jgi:hypothetical protein
MSSKALRTVVVLGTCCWRRSYFLIINSMGRGSNKDLNSTILSIPLEGDATWWLEGEEENAI